MGINNIFCIILHSVFNAYILVMMKKCYLITVLSIITSISKLSAQSTNLSIEDESMHTLERMETLFGSFDNELFLTTKGVSRKDVAAFFYSQRTDKQSGYYSNVDMKLANDAIANSGEWIPPTGNGAYANKKPLLNTIYATKNDFLSYNKNHSYFSINPVLNLTGYYESSDNSSNILNGGKSQLGIGFEARGKYKDWLGFDVMYLGQRESPVSFFANYIEQQQAFPGIGNYTRTINGTNINYAYSFLRANVYIPIVKNHIDLSLGYDQQFIGDGYRSLMLSNFSGNALYAKIRTKVWKFQYQNLFLKYDAQNIYKGYTGPTVENKYAAIHHLGINIFPWLNVGLFESVIFGRTDHYEFGYMNPVIFYRAIERSMGSPDKLIIGVNAKAIIANRVKMYGQFIINEFTAKEFFSGSGYWGNKWGAQLGLHYFDALGITNFDIQLEGNAVRPYTYAAQQKLDAQTLSNYSHHNMALAHPLGAGFLEGLVRLKYRPGLNWSIALNAMAYRQGRDIYPTENNGNNILLDYNVNVPKMTGIGMINGAPVTTILTDLNVSYQIWPGLYADLGGAYRVQQTATETISSMYGYFGVRMNLARRNYAVF